MWAYALVVSVVSVLALFMTNSGEDDTLVDTTRRRALAEGMATYRAAVVEMARAQPAFEGAVSEAALSLPTWWQVQPALKATVEGRMVAVYVETNDEQAGVLQEMFRLSAGSMMVGIANKSSGTLHSPSTGNTGITVPAGVPDGAPVWLATRD
jgi:hypothetical protein